MRLATVGFVATMLVLLTFPLASAQDDDPYARGYQQGYQAENPGSPPPVTPIEPIEPLGQTHYGQGIKDGTQSGLEDNGQDRQSGYDEGYQQGQDDAVPDDGDGGDDSQ